MKHILITLCAILLSATAWSQYAFTDAQLLTNNKWAEYSTVTNKVEIKVTKENANIILAVLSNYLTAAQRITVESLADPVQKYGVYKNAFADNEFISLAGSVQQNQLSDLRLRANDAQRILPGNVGGLDITNLADGLAKFLVKRTKEELTAAFFEDFYTTINKQKDLQLFFPETYNILAVAGTQVYNYQTYLPALREAFKHDLDGFFNDAYAWAKSDAPWISQLRANHSETYALVKASFYTGTELINGKHPGDVLHQLIALNSATASPSSDSMALATISADLVPSLQTVDLFSQSLRAADMTSYWITRKDFSAFADPVLARLYAGFLYQQVTNDPIVFSNGKTLAGIFKGMAMRANVLHDLVSAYYSQFNQLEDQLIKIRAIDQPEATAYFNLIKGTLALLEYTTTASVLTLPSLRKEINQFTFYTTHISALWSHLQTKSYNSAVYDAYVILDSALYDHKSKEALQYFLKYGSFIATVATAETSDEVEQAIEANVLPAGSYSVKRKSKSNIALNAYVGLSPGWEWNESKFKDGRFTFAVSAPIGITFSKGIYHYNEKTKLYKEGGSASLFISLVDLGAVTAYRFNDANTDALPQLTLSNVFSPGVYYVKGFADSPVSLGIGGQLGPQLRKVQNSSLSADTGINYTLKIFLAVDIPLLNFKTRSR